MHRAILLAVAVVLLAALGFLAWRGSPPPLAGGGRPIQGLQPGDGRGFILTHCTVCHSAALVVSFRANRAGWDAVITRMQQEEGLWGFSTEDREVLLDYLEATQGPVSSGELPGSPWAQPLYPPNPIW